MADNDILTKTKDVLLGMLASTLGSGPDLINTLKPGSVYYGTSSRARQMLGLPDKLPDDEEAMIAVGSLLTGLFGGAAAAGTNIARKAKAALTNSEWRSLVAEANAATMGKNLKTEKEYRDMVTRVHDILFRAGQRSGKGFANRKQSPLSDNANVPEYGILRIIDETPGQNLMNMIAKGRGEVPVNIPAHLQKSLSFDIKKGLNKAHAAEISRQEFNNTGLNALFRPTETVPLSFNSRIPSLLYDTLGQDRSPTTTTYQVLEEALKRGLLLRK